MYLFVSLQIRRNTSSSSEESMRATPMSAKEYVESLHQNSRTQLLYGKNNVMVQPVLYTDKKVSWALRSFSFLNFYPGDSLSYTYRWHCVVIRKYVNILREHLYVL